MRVLRAQFLALVRGEIGDQQTATGNDKPRGFGKRGFGRGDEMQHLVQDHGVRRGVGQWQRADVALSQFPSRTTIKFCAGEAEHFGAAVDAYGMIGLRTKKFDHATRASANVHQPTDGRTDDRAHPVFNGAVGDME